MLRWASRHIGAFHRSCPGTFGTCLIQNFSSGRDRRNGTRIRRAFCKEGKNDDSDRDWRNPLTTSREAFALIRLTRSSIGRNAYFQKEEPHDYGRNRGEGPSLIRFFCVGKNVVLSILIIFPESQMAPQLLIFKHRLIRKEVGRLGSAYGIWSPPHLVTVRQSRAERREKREVLQSGE